MRGRVGQRCTAARTGTRTLQRSRLGATKQPTHQKKKNQKIYNANCVASVLSACACCACVHLRQLTVAMEAALARANSSSDSAPSWCNSTNLFRSSISKCRSAAQGTYTHITKRSRRERPPKFNIRHENTKDFFVGCKMQVECGIRTASLWLFWGILCSYIVPASRRSNQTQAAQHKRQGTNGAPHHQRRRVIVKILPNLNCDLILFTLFEQKQWCSAAAAR